MAMRWKTGVGRSFAADGATIGDATIGEAATAGAAGGIVITGAIAAEDGAMVTIADTDTVMVMTTKEEQSAIRKAPGTGPFLLAWKRCGV